MPRILITGCSSGFGEAIAERFLDEGWDVVATMRVPSTEGLPTSDHLQILPLDVTDPESIANALENAGPLDALVNNAGVGMLNVLEGAEMDRVRELFETNILGAIAVTKAAMNAFTKSFALEAAEFGVRVRLVLPGSAPQTSFGRNAVQRMGLDVPEAYSAFVQSYIQTLQSATQTTEPREVAQVVLRAVTDENAPMTLPAGVDANAWYNERFDHE